MTRPSKRELANGIETLRQDSKGAESAPLIAFRDPTTGELFADNDLAGEPLDDDAIAHVVMAIDPTWDTDDGGDSP